MVILGLGSNIGNKVQNLRTAYERLKKVSGLIIEQVSPLYRSDPLLPDNADSSCNVPYLNLAIRCRTTLSPYALLAQTKTIEKSLGRDSTIHWSPRIIDIDILAWGDLISYDKILHIPHENLHERPFALWPLADVAPFWKYPLPGAFQGKTAVELAQQWPRDKAPLHTQQVAQRIDTPALMGIINITPDSFSDGGKYIEPIHAVNQAIALINAGAEILDLGAESTGPLAPALSPKKEWERLEPVLNLLSHLKKEMPIPPQLSIDTRHPETAEKALTVGIDWINDVTGLDNPGMRALLTDQRCRIVLMHHLGIPANQSIVLPHHEDPVLAIYQWAEQRLSRLKFPPERLIFDVGIGYGKTAEQSLLLIKNISLFKGLGLPLLVGHSRKSFLTHYTVAPAPERDIETLATSLYLANQGVDYLRIHNVAMHAKALKVAFSLNT